ncbi:hypothetical protein TcasGA2_TC007714 [Tribolium castaneum]|uniref:PAP-associated domain-containing protein n=1 Tax=Tribolium castaneum TaxID=7070 RepID=D2A1V6_TRICA|nr:hypothetical protein TcasGA2_TC007714 [Tribolium castaneum]
MVLLLCKICDRKIEFSQWKKHISNESHVRSLPSSIFIKGTPLNTKLNAVCEHFAKFGKLTKRESLDFGTTLEISYEDPNIYSDVVHREHAVEGEILKIFWYKTVKSFKVVVSFTKQEAITNGATRRIVELAKLLKDAQSFEQELEIFLDTVKSYNDDFGRKSQVIRGLLLSHFNKVVFYGSSILDVDVFTRNCNLYLETGKPILPILIGSNRFSNSMLTSEGAKCIYEDSEIRVACCVNLHKLLFVKTCDLVKYYLTLDEKDYTSSYMLYLMVIFYLQQEPFKLPAVLSLQEDSFTNFVDGWNCYFFPKVVTSPALENATLLKLLEGFFEFYSHFDYFTYVICPYLGSPLKKTVFLDSCELPESFDLYTKSSEKLQVNSGLCIQDPFNHSSNISKAMTDEMCGKLMTLCRVTSNLIKSGETRLYNLWMNNMHNLFEQITIEQDCEMDEKLWTQTVKDVLYQILTQVLFLDVKPGPNCTHLPDCYVYSCTNTKSNTESFVGKVTVKLAFNYGPRNKASVILKTNNPNFHLAHLIFIKLTSFLKEKIENLKNVTNKPNVKQVLISHLRSGTNLLHQLLILLKNLPGKNDHSIKILQDVKLMLTSQYPKIKIKIFGSRVMKLGTCFSHLDFSLSKIASSDMTLLGELLSKFNIFTDVSIVNNGATLQCTHKATQTICHLWFVNHLWLANERLVRWYFSSGVVVRQMYMVVKFWTICNDLDNHFTSYVLYLLVVFFLQQNHKFPSVATLQKDVPPYRINKWNCNFKQIEFLSNKCVKLSELLAGFFQFYSNFDYISYVVSPYFGAPLHKLDSNETFKIHSGLCVQDFFVLSSNVTASIPLNIAGIFANLCQKTHRVLSLSTPQLHTVLSRVGTDCSFFIEMEQGRNELAWQQSVKEHTLKIISKVLGCKNINIIIVSSTYIKYMFVEMKHFWDKRADFMKSLQQQLNGCSDIERDITITAHITKVSPSDADWKSSLELKFHQNPTKVQITVIGNYNQTHTCYFFFTRLLKLLGEKPEISRNIQIPLLGNDNTVAEWTGNYAELYRPITERIEGDFSEQIATFQKFQTEVTKNVDIITRDIGSVFTNPTTIGVFLPGDILDFFVDCDKESDMVILLSKSSEFRDVTLIQKCQNLVVTCTHRKTGIVCHLDNRHKVAHATSHMIQAYLHEKQVLLFFNIIKLWAGRCKFMDECGFTSYIFNLMIIFFLQHELHYPAVADLQKSVNWGEILLKKSLHELLVAFFKFYGDFDYISFVVAPFCGVAVEKSMLQDKKFPVNSGLCIQDLIDHSCNVSAEVTLNSSGKFAEMCRRAYTCMTDNQDLVPLVNPPICNFAAFKIEETGHKNEKEWIQLLRISVTKILVDMLGCKVSSVGNYNTFCVVYNCVLNHDIWSERMSALKQLNGSDTLSKETSATMFIKEKYGATSLSKFVVNMSFDKDPISVQIEIRGTGDIFHLTHFVYTRLKLILDNNIEDDASPTDEVDLNQELLDDACSKESDEMFEKLVASLQEASTIDEQMAIFSKILHYSKIEIEEIRDLIQIDLYSALSPTFPSHKIEFFGSNIGFKNSDFDINIDNITSDIPTLELVKTRVMACSNFSNVTMGDKQIKFKHDETDANCCLYVKNKMWVSTSNLINYYLSLDNKLCDVFSVINFWADYYGLKNGFFTTYSLNLLILFYLEQEPYKLPRVKDLQKDVTPQIVDGWNCAFNCLKCDSLPLQNASIAHLVIGFFHYYANFDYVSFVISPYFGTVIEKIRFVNQHFVVNCGVAIQNIFELSKNVSSDVPLGCVGRFAALCRNSVEALTKDLKLTHLLEAKADCIFEIGNLHKYDVEAFGILVKRLILRVLNILNAKVIEKSYFRYECEVKKSVFDNVKNISSPIHATNDIIRDIIVTTFSEGLIQFSLTIDATKNVCKIALLGEENDLIYFMTHFIYIKLLKYLTEKPDQVSCGTKPSVLSSNFQTNDDEQNDSFEDDDEDIPSDFFDDFSKEEFLNGLDLEFCDEKRPKRRIRCSSSSSESSTPPRKKKSISPHHDVNAQPTEAPQPVDNIDQLFVERKISLTDFLTLTLRREVKTNSEEKMKLISRCQEAIKILSEDLLIFPSKFTVTPSNKVVDSNKLRIKYRSPLLRNLVKFNFTTYQGPKKLDTFSQSLDHVLQRLGLLKEDNNLENLIDSITTALINSPIVDKETVASILKASLLNLNCVNCDSKLMIQHVDVATQCRFECERNGFDEDSGTFFV